MTVPHTEQGERQALRDEMDKLEAGPRDGGLGDRLRASLIERIEHRLDVLGGAASTEEERNA